MKLLEAFDQLVRILETSGFRLIDGQASRLTEFLRCEWSWGQGQLHMRLKLEFRDPIRQEGHDAVTLQLAETLFGMIGRSIRVEWNPIDGWIRRTVDDGDVFSDLIETIFDRLPPGDLEDGHASSSVVLETARTLVESYTKSSEIKASVPTQTPKRRKRARVKSK